jgi:chromosome partitioning protein
MRRIAFINEKGGTGKTTLAVNTAAYLARQKGQRVLLIDLDSQGHAAKCLGVDVRTLPINVFHLLTDPAVQLEEVTQRTRIPNLFVVPAYKQMAGFPTAVAGEPAQAGLLERRVTGEAAVDYDVVLFDTPPSMGLATTNVLRAATELVIPVSLTYLALDGCAELMESVREVAAAAGRAPPRISLVVPTFYRNTSLADEILSRLKHYFPGALSATPLAFNVKIDEAQSHGETIWEYAPSSRGAEMLRTIGEELWSAEERWDQSSAAPPTPPAA